MWDFVKKAFSQFSQLIGLDKQIESEQYKIVNEIQKRKEEDPFQKIIKQIPVPMPDLPSSFEVADLDDELIGLHQNRMEEYKNIFESAKMDFSIYEKTYKGILDDLTEASQKPLGDVSLDEINRMLRKMLAQHNNVASALRKELLKKSDSWGKEQEQLILDKHLESIKKKLEVIAKIKQKLDGLSWSPGFLWDLMQGDLHSSDIDQLVQWLSLLENNTNIKNLAAVLGKMYRNHLESKVERVTQTHAVFQQTFSIPEEIVDLEYSNDILRMVPSEYLYLTHPKFKLIFAKKYAEKQLLSYKKEGFETSDEATDDEVATQTLQAKGPIILCVDTSGSMQGTPELLAKASAFIMVQSAISESRDCYLINFSTKITTSIFTKDFGMDSLLKFLSLSFSGGTDVTPALKEATSKMQTEEFTNADCLIISDFVMPNPTKDLQTQIDTLKTEQNNNFYGLSIGEGKDEVPDFFDSFWVYDPATNDIEEIMNKLHA